MNRDASPLTQFVFREEGSPEKLVHLEPRWGFPGKKHHPWVHKKAINSALPGENKDPGAKGYPLPDNTVPKFTFRKHKVIYRPEPDVRSLDGRDLPVEDEEEGEGEEEEEEEGKEAGEEADEEDEEEDEEEESQGQQDDDDDDYGYEQLVKISPGDEFPGCLNTT